MKNSFTDLSFFQSFGLPIAITTGLMGLIGMVCFNIHYPPYHHAMQQPKSFIYYWGQQSSIHQLIDEQAYLQDTSILFLPSIQTIPTADQAGLVMGTLMTQNPIFTYQQNLWETSSIDAITDNACEVCFDLRGILATWQQVDHPIAHSHTAHTLHFKYQPLMGSCKVPTQTQSAPALMSQDLWENARFFTHFENGRAVGPSILYQSTGSTEIDSTLKTLLPTVHSCEDTSYQEINIYP